ncbi:hypothetical protein [Polaribacter aestuariivivens]|uniref:hypothetical protein n=1 Tax=Polaribacter aestuariivivens TaxID=2304626 RepID=UPI003F4968C1
MKQILSIIITIFLVGCNSNDDETLPILEKNFSQVYLSNLGQTPCLGCSVKTYDFELSFLAKNITVTESGLTEGVGAKLRLELLSETPNLPKAGIYRYLGGIVVPLNLTSASYQISELKEKDFNTPYYYFDADSSQMEISYDGTQMIINYNINLNVQDSSKFEEKINITGKWDGDVKIIRDKLF